jgi:uncharacterized protein
VTLTAGTYVIGAANAATVTITENTPTVTVVATDPTADEAGPESGTFTFTRTGPTTVALVVTYTVSGTATNGEDYFGLGGAVLIPEGQSSVTVTVTPMLDGLAEANETVVVTLTAGTYVIGAANAATVTITENTPTVTVVATDPTADEAGPDPGTVTVGRSPGSTGGGT